MAAHISTFLSLNDNMIRKRAAAKSQAQTASVKTTHAGQAARTMVNNMQTRSNTNSPIFRSNDSENKQSLRDQPRQRNHSTESSPMIKPANVEQDYNIDQNQDNLQSSDSQPTGFGTSLFRDNISSSFTSGFGSFLRRRFSSAEDPTAADGGIEPGTVAMDDESTPRPTNDLAMTTTARSACKQNIVSGPPPAGYAAAAANNTSSTTQAQAPTSAFSLSGLSSRDSAISAPASPSKQIAPASQPISMVSQVQGLTKNLFQAATGQKAYNKDKCKCLLVIDHDHIDWTKYFRNKKVLNEFELRVEQAEFSEMRLASYSDSGCIVELNVLRNGNRVQKSVEPDFLLVRQRVRTEKDDHTSVLLALMYGAVPSLNSINSIYNFRDKPWVFAHLFAIQRRLGKETFPVIDQAYYPTHADLTQIPSFPVVIKMGHGRQGMGKMRVNSQSEFDDVMSVIGAAQQYYSVEPYIHGKYDLHLQKIGNIYKAFIRKSIGDDWKTNRGSAMLEQVAMIDRYKLWLDETSELFGGMDMCALELVVAQDGTEHIINAHDCSFALIGDSQEEDRRQITELALTKMSHIIGVRKSLIGAQTVSIEDQSKSPAHFIKHETPPKQMSNGKHMPPPPPMRQAPPPLPPGARPAPSPPARGPPPRPVRAPSIPNESPKNDVSDMTIDDEKTEDTMGNLKKTFAGIFGDM